MQTTPCGCALKCFDKVTEQQRKSIFEGFWGLGEFNVQNAYLCGAVKILEIKRRYTSAGCDSRRSKTRTYYVNNGSVSIRVCKVAFLRMHAISNGRLSRVLQGQVTSGGTPKRDARGCHEPANKTSADCIAGVKAHIESFPTYQSHYSRADSPQRRFLSPDLSIGKMYELYKSYCSEKECTPVSEWVYRKIFNEEYNFCFGR